MVTQLNEETMDILLYLFENYLARNALTTLKHRQIFAELEQAGFQPEEIQYAIAALEAMGKILGASFLGTEKNPPVVRIFNRQEARKLDVLAQGFILLLEQLGVLDEIMRERVIEYALLLNTEEVGLDELKWVILAVLINPAALAEVLPVYAEFSLENNIGGLH